MKSIGHKTVRATCPYCGKRVALTRTGKLYPHRDKITKTPCVRRSTN